MGIENFSFKQYQEEYQVEINKIVFVVSGTFMGQPFKERLLKPDTMEGYSKDGILGEIAEIVREKFAVENGPLDQAALDGMEAAKRLIDTAQRLVDTLGLDESIGYFVVTLRCKHKYATGHNTECPMCGEIV